MSTQLRGSAALLQQPRRCTPREWQVSPFKIGTIRRESVRETEAVGEWSVLEDLLEEVHGHVQLVVELLGAT